jgi:competence protein ComEC
MFKKASCFVISLLLLTVFARTGSTDIDGNAVFTDNLTVHFIDVGQGDSILIESPSKNVLIDGGSRDSGVLGYLQENDIVHLDLVIGTHPHDDHIGGLIAVLGSIPVTEIYDPGISYTTRTFEDYMSVIDDKNIKFAAARAGMGYDLGGGAVMEIYNPVNISEISINNASIVVRITYGSVSFLLTGDAGSEAESSMIQLGYDLRSDILKTGHHGSNDSSPQYFLDAVDPGTAIISCGRDNPYGYPHDETLHRLSDSDIDIYRTDLLGTIIVETDGQTYRIRTDQNR